MRPIATLLMMICLISPGVIPTVHAKQSPSRQEVPPPPLSPWLKPRELSSFQALLPHSPFSLPTAEESSPLSERYAVTGILTIDGEEEIFVLDKNDQSRELLTKKSNKKSMTLVNIVKETDPNKLKATIRVGEETGVITSPELSTNNPTHGPQRFPGFPTLPANGNTQGNMPQKNPLYPPNSPYYPGQMPPNAPHLPGGIPNTGIPNNYRVINRPPIPN